MTNCDYCRKKILEILPWECHRCNGIYCSDHRLPEDHLCRGMIHRPKTKSNHQPKKQMVIKIPLITSPQPEPKPPEKNIVRQFDNIPRKRLCEIINTYEKTIIDHPKRFKAILNDLCQGKFRREINVIMTSLDEKIPQEIIKSKSKIPYNVLFGQLKQRLSENSYHSDDLIVWAIESWMIAFQFNTQ